MSDMPPVRLSNPQTIHKPFGYSHVAEVAVTGGKLVYLLGQVAFDAQGNLVGKDDFEAQVRLFANLAAALKPSARTSVTLSS